MNIHFFGCSYTAGDELSDDTVFPWKQNHAMTSTEYFKLRSTILASNFPDSWHEYVSKNKSMAYPALLTKATCFNHATNGSSLRECVFKIYKTVTELKDIDGIFLQIPPFPRELYLVGDTSISIQLTGGTNIKQVKNYAFEKIISHQLYQYAVEDLMDLNLIHTYVEKHNIPLRIIDFKKEVQGRINVLPESFRWLETSGIHKKVLDFSYLNIPDNLLLGGHFNKETQTKIAQDIEVIIDLWNG